MSAGFDVYRMSLSPEPVEIPTPPDSPTDQWCPVESETEGEDEVVIHSPSKRIRAPIARASAPRKRVKRSEGNQDVFRESVLEEEEEDHDAALDDDHEAPVATCDADFGFYVGAVEGGIAPFYPLKGSQFRFVVRGWDHKRRCPSVRLHHISQSLILIPY